MEIVVYGTSIVLGAGGLLALCGAVMLVRVAGAVGAWFDRQMLDRLVEALSAVVLGDLRSGLLKLDDIHFRNAHIISLASSITQAMRDTQIEIDTSAIITLALARVAERLKQRALHPEVDLYQTRISWMVSSLKSRSPELGCW